MSRKNLKKDEFRDYFENYRDYKELVVQFLELEKIENYVEENVDEKLSLCSFHSIVEKIPEEYTFGNSLRVHHIFLVILSLFVFLPTAIFAAQTVHEIRTVSKKIRI